MDCSDNNRRELIQGLVESDAPLLSYEPLASAPSRSVDHPHPSMFELEDWYISLGKRIYAQLNIFVMFGNTINVIFSIAAAISLIPKPDYNDIYDFCAHGPPIVVQVQCPYMQDPVFGVFIGIWSIYFLTFFIYKFQRTYPFWSNDLRFYLASDMVNNELFLYGLVYVGFILTIISTLTGLTFVIQNGSNDSIGNLSVFTVVNFHALYSMLGGHYVRLRSLNIDTDFPYPIMLKPGPLVDRVRLNHRDLFDGIISAVMASYVNKDDVTLSELGDPQQLRDVVNLLLDVKLSTESF